VADERLWPPFGGMRWERAGENAEAMRENYAGGWDVVLGKYVAELVS
jgi:hypothetical protein